MAYLVVKIAGTALAACLIAGSAGAQLIEASSLPLPSSVQSTLGAELRQMAAQAGVIFAGQVVGIRAESSSSSTGSGAVEVTFRVDQAIRGSTQGRYVLREWAGLWVGGVERYRVGDQLLMLLHAPGASGMNSPIGGKDGAIPITGGGPAPTAKDAFTTPSSQGVDLRWIQARLLRSDPAPQTEMVTAKDTLALRNAPWTAPYVSGGTVALATLRGVTQGMSLQSLLALLTAWEAQPSDVVR